MKLTLKAARTNAGMSREYVADCVGVTAQTIGNWERGKRLIPARTLFFLADLYNISVSDFSLPDMSPLK